MIRIAYMFFVTFVFLMLYCVQFVFANDLNNGPVEASFMDSMLGPMGALILSIVGLGITYRVIIHLQKQNQEYAIKIEHLYERILDEKTKQIEIILTKEKKPKS